MKATKILPSLQNEPYQERLKIPKLLTLKFHSQRGDMIETGQWLGYMTTVMPNMLYYRGLKIVHYCYHYDLRKYCFCNRITNVWNSLPEDTVNALSVNS